MDRSFSNGNGQSMSNGTGGSKGPAAITVCGVTLGRVPEVYAELAPGQM